jgi:hypothetical protein
MDIFKRKKLAKEAGSGSAFTTGHRLGRLLSKKSPKTQQDAGPTPSSAADGPTQQERREDGSNATVPKHRLPMDQDEMRNVRSLWDCSYDALKEENPQLVIKYEKLLSAELAQKRMYHLHSECYRHSDGRRFRFE